MKQDDSPQRIAVIWSPEARAQLRHIDKESAMQILYCLDRYLSTRKGDVKKLKKPLKSLRLRCGDYRVFFEFKAASTIEIIGVYPRKEAYR